MTRGTVLRAAAIICAACLAGCGEGGEGGGEPPRAPAEEVQEAPAQATARPRPPRPRQARTSTPAAAPTARDSAAAAAEDVSPEWKMNERKMGPYADCLAQARAAPSESRERLEEACGRLPSAPRR